MIGFYKKKPESNKTKRTERKQTPSWLTSIETKIQHKRNNNDDDQRPRQCISEAITKVKYLYYSVSYTYVKLLYLSADTAGRNPQSITAVTQRNSVLMNINAFHSSEYLWVVVVSNAQSQISLVNQTGR